jgi:hypothetical protein
MAAIEAQAADLSTFVSMGRTLETRQAEASSTVKARVQLSSDTV